jgi:hypothetical protein
MPDFSPVKKWCYSCLQPKPFSGLSPVYCSFFCQYLAQGLLLVMHSSLKSMLSPLQIGDMVDLIKLSQHALSRDFVVRVPLDFAPSVRAGLYRVLITSCLAALYNEAPLVPSSPDTRPLSGQQAQVLPSHAADRLSNVPVFFRGFLDSQFHELCGLLNV